MKKVITIGMAEDHLIVREGMISLLKRFKEVSVLFDVNNGKELLVALLTSKPDVILLDIDMPEMDGREALDQIRVLYPEIKVIMLTVHYSEAHILDCLKRGANAFLYKDAGIAKILEAINAVCRDGYFYDKKVSETLSKQFKNGESKGSGSSESKISEREITILEYLYQNKSNPEIAEKLSISLRTVEGYRSSLMHKTGAKNLAALISYAIEHGLIFPKTPDNF